MSAENEWASATQQDFTALALTTAMLDGDDELTAATLAGLSREQVVALAVTIADWLVWALGEAGLNPAEHVRRVALDLARRASGIDPDE